MNNKIRVLIADDTDIAREGMRRILAAEVDMEIVGEGATVHETVQKVHELRPDVLLLDLKWFGDKDAGIETIKRLTSEVPETKIVAITVYPHLIEQAKNAGALAALTKEVPKQQLIDEIRSVYAVPPPPPSPAQVVTSPAPPAEELTEREREVLTLMAEGKKDKQIAVALGIAESTAKNHVGNILGKLGVPNRAAAVAMGYELGLIGTEKKDP
ncbi:MAG: LuxR C-terminal-related transcriptional regulator [Anaerolineae bacterium]